MRPIMQVGDKWDCVECVETEILEDEEYGGRFGGHRVYRLRCACGEVWEVTWKEWKGKRKTHDCGCGIWSSREVMTTLCITIPYGLRVEWDRFCDQHRLNKSECVRKAMRIAMDYWDAIEH